MFPMRSVKSSSPAMIMTTQNRVSPKSTEGTRAFPKELQTAGAQERGTRHEAQGMGHKAWGTRREHLWPQLSLERDGAQGRGTKQGHQWLNVKAYQRTTCSAIPDGQESKEI